MHLRLLLLACLALAANGCATDNQTAQPSSSRGPGDYRTGSRLPSYDPPGTSASRDVNADDWNDARRGAGSNTGTFK